MCYFVENEIQVSIQAFISSLCAPYSYQSGNVVLEAYRIIKSAILIIIIKEKLNIITAWNIKNVPNSQLK